MKKQQRVRLKLLILLLVFILCMGNGCFLDGPPPTITTPDRQAWFEPEYDYMTGYNIFPPGDDFAYDAFQKCNTFFDPYFDDNISPAISIDYESLYIYGYNHADLDNNYELQSKSYILSLPDATSKPNLTVLGATLYGGQEGGAMSFIFVQAINDKYNLDFEHVRELTVIHELGHLRADLSHLCIDDSTKNNAHNNYNCVMAQGGLVTSCTNEQISHDFCPNDQNRISAIKW